MERYNAKENIELFIDAEVSSSDPTLSLVLHKFKIRSKFGFKGSLAGHLPILKIK
jgi:hypothetical protein